VPGLQVIAICEHVRTFIHSVRGMGGTSGVAFHSIGSLATVGLESHNEHTYGRVEELSAL
jgi:hypothetical protein